MEYAILGIAAVAAFLFFGARWTARRNVDPIVVSTAASLRLCAEGQITQELLAEHIRTMFTMYDIPIGRQNVARRLMFATTVIDRQFVSPKVKKEAKRIAFEVTKHF